MGAAYSDIPLIAVNEAKGTFKVPRQSFVDPAVLQAERARIFDECWLYLGHGSELKKNGDFLTRGLANRNLVFNRDVSGQVNAFLNTCPHRGAMVCRERAGNAKSFQCFYHGWVFASDGKLKSQPGQDCYPTTFNEANGANLTPVPLLAQYRDFYFVCFDRNAVSLHDYLGNAREYIDLVADQSSAGMGIVGGTQEYSIRANWKLLSENSIDGYHAATTHATYIDYLLNTSGGVTKMALEGVARDLGSGHAVIEYTAPWGRPIAQWIPVWGEEGKRELNAAHERLVAQFGAERARRMAFHNRNLLVFPNLIINDIMSITVRTYYPAAPDSVLVNAWALAPQEESEWARKSRLYNFLEFLGPGGFATPDDVEALEQCQRGFQNSAEVPWNDISKGMLKDVPAMDDEAQMRAFWTQWQRRLLASAG